MLRFHSPDLVRSGFVRTPDGVHLYWRAVGNGPLLACCNGVGVGTFFWKYLVAHLRDRYTVVVWDYRGHGRSDRRLDASHTDLSIQRHADDLMLVLDAAGRPGEQAILAGHSMGCQVALEALRRNGERVRALVLMQGTAGNVLDTFYDNPRSPLLIRKLRGLTSASGRLANLIMPPLLSSPVAMVFARLTGQVDRHYTAQEDLENYLRHLSSLDQRLFLECVLEAQAHSAWDLLPDIEVPTLIIGAERDLFTPVGCSRRMAELIPGAELMVVPNATHAGLIEQPSVINRRVDQFLAERVDSAQDADEGEEPANLTRLRSAG